MHKPLYVCICYIIVYIHVTLWSWSVPWLNILKSWCSNLCRYWREVEPSTSVVYLKQNKTKWNKKVICRCDLDVYIVSISLLCFFFFLTAIIPLPCISPLIYIYHSRTSQSNWVNQLFSETSETVSQISLPLITLTILNNNIIAID